VRDISDLQIQHARHVLQVSGEILETPHEIDETPSVLVVDELVLGRQVVPYPQSHLALELAREMSLQEPHERHLDPPIAAPGTEVAPVDPPFPFGHDQVEGIPHERELEISIERVAVDQVVIEKLPCARMLQGNSDLVVPTIDLLLGPLIPQDLLD
jgi:hypothetical protein